MIRFVKNITYMALFFSFMASSVQAMNAIDQAELDRQLFDATAQGNLSLVENLVNQGANVNIVVDDQGFGQHYQLTPLLVAAVHGHWDILKFLIEHDANINYENGACHTALYWASARGNLEVVGLLLQLGAHTYTRDRFATNPFGVALYAYLLSIYYRFSADYRLIKEIELNLDRSVYLKIMQLLLDYGADLNARGEGEALMQVVRAGLELSRNEGEFDSIRGYRALLFLLEHGGVSPNLAEVDFLVEQDLSMIHQLIRLPLNTAAATGDRDTITQLLEAIPHEVRAENLVLQQAAQAQSPSVIQTIQAYFKGLINAAYGGTQQQANFVDINQRDAHGFTALHWAAAQGHVDIVQALLEAGANFMLTNRLGHNEGLTALQLAQRNGREAAAREDINTAKRYQNVIRLLETYAMGSVIREVLQEAFVALPNRQDFNPEDVIQHILDQAETLGGIAPVDAQDTDGNTALHYAALHNNTYGIRSLLSDGAHVNVRNNDGNTPLHLAMRHNNADIVRAVLAAHADHTVENMDGNTALHYAALHNNTHGIRILLSNGANINAVNSDGNTPLHAAVLRNTVLSIEALLAHNANINAINGNGDTPLHLAIQQGHAGIVQILLNAHADHTICNTRSQTPFDVARELGHTAIIDMLSRERIIPEILRDQELFQQVHAQGRNVPAIGMPEEIIARIVRFLSNPNPNSNG